MLGENQPPNTECGMRNAELSSPTYRADLRDLNELHFARFEAKLGERLAQLESHLTWRMFAFWAPTAIAVIAPGAGVISLLLRHWNCLRRPPPPPSPQRGQADPKGLPAGRRG